jgi:hypothetical protein
MLEEGTYKGLIAPKLTANVILHCYVSLNVLLEVAFQAEIF